MPKPKGVLDKDERHWCLLELVYRSFSLGYPKCPAVLHAEQVYRKQVNPHQTIVHVAGENYTPHELLCGPRESPRSCKSTFCFHPGPRCRFSSSGSQDDISAPHPHALLCFNFWWVFLLLVQIQKRSVVIEIISGTSTCVSHMKWIGSSVRTRYGLDMAF